MEIQVETQEQSDNRLTGKTFVVTGATAGIGLAAARTLAARGAEVIGIGRSQERCQQAERSLRALNPQAEARYITADLSLQSDVRAAAQQVRAILAQRETRALNGLINNAGTFTYWLTLTREGFETQWAVNHLAPFLLTHELLPLLAAADSARVVTVSSDSHYGARLNWDDLQLRRRYNGLRAYGQSKLANVLFTREFNQRAQSDGHVRALAADPGLVKTDIGLKNQPPLVRWVWQIRRSGGVPAEESGGWVAYLVSDPAIQSSPEIYWKAGQPKKTSRLAQDLNEAQRLWAVSEKMCDIQTYGEAA